MAMLTAYVDESRTDGAQPYPVIGGYLSTVENWIELTQRWKERLRESGVMCLHMADLWANSRGSEFEDRSRWNFTAKCSLVSDLLDIVERHVVCSIAASIDNGAYLEVVGERASRRNKHGSQYELCGVRVALLVGKWAKQNAPYHVSFVFDEGNRYRHQFERGYGIVRRVPEPWARHLGPLTFASDEHVAALQAADLFAWTVSRTAHDELVSARTTASVPWASRLWNQQPCLEGHYERELLVKLRDESNYWARQDDSPMSDRELNQFFRAVAPASEKGS